MGEEHVLIITAEYDCVNRVGLAIQFYITTNNLCIDSIFSNHKILFPLKSVNMKKVRYFLHANLILFIIYYLLNLFVR